MRNLPQFRSGPQPVHLIEPGEVIQPVTRAGQRLVGDGWQAVGAVALEGFDEPEQISARATPQGLELLLVDDAGRLGEVLKVSRAELNRPKRIADVVADDGENPLLEVARQRELLREFEAISNEDNARHNPRAKGWLDKVKEFFEP